MKIDGLCCAIALAVLSDTAAAQWGGSWSLSRPQTQTIMGVQHEGADYSLIPYDLIDRMAHKKLRKLIGGVNIGEGFMFFVATIDNTKGKSPVAFHAFEEPITIFCTRPGEQDPMIYYIVDLRDYFADPDNAPQDVDAYKKAREMFRPDLTIPPGKTGWSLVAFRDTVNFERLLKVEWGMPGVKPKPLAERKYDPSAIKKFGVEVLPWD